MGRKGARGHGSGACPTGGQTHGRGRVAVGETEEAAAGEVEGPFYAHLRQEVGVVADHEQCTSVLGEGGGEARAGGASWPWYCLLADRGSGIGNRG